MTISAFSIKMEVIITPDFGDLYQSHKKRTMADDKRWKILERVTTGWVLIAADADELTKAGFSAVNLEGGYMAWTG